MSVVGQHMQQAGATPAEAMAFTLAHRDAVRRGLHRARHGPGRVLPRFTFFFDISMSFFEEIAKFRAGRRIWARLARERLGAKDPRSWRFKFHGQTSGVDLTRQQPLNNIARVTAQAMAGIFGGLQSLHTDAYDEAFRRRAKRRPHRHRDPEHPARGSAPDRRDRPARRLVLRRGADRPDGGQDRLDHANGRRGRRHVQGGRVGARATDDRRLGDARSRTGSTRASRWSSASTSTRPRTSPAAGPRSSGRTRTRCAAMSRRSSRRRPPARRARSRKALDALTRSAESADGNVFGAVVDGARAGLTHEEICSRLRRDLGFGQPLVIV